MMEDVSGLPISLNNTGDQLLLRDGVGARVDYVAWEGFAAGWDLMAPIGRASPATRTCADTTGRWRRPTVRPASK